MNERAVMLAAEWIGTPFRHQGRTRKHGVDCAGLVICVGIEMGVLSLDALPSYASHYGRVPNPHHIERTLSLLFVETGDVIEPGDILWYGSARLPIHMGIYAGEGYVIHADGNIGRVVRVPFNEVLRGAYRYKENG